MLKNANWGTVQPFCFSSQRKGAFIEFNVEFKSSGEPMVDFHKYFNSENIVTLQEDLVTWINVGMVRVFPPVYLDSYGGMYSFSLLLKIRLTPRLQPLLPGIILYLKSPFRFSSTCSISLNLSTSFMLTSVNYFDYDITMECHSLFILFKNETIAVSSKISTVCQMIHRILNILGLEWLVWTGLWILKGWLRLDERRICLLG